MNPLILNLNLNALTRRASLLTLGVAGLTAVFASPLTTGAKKKHGKNKGKQGNAKLCKKQVGQCLDVLTPACAGDPTCLALLDRCCPSLGTCDFDGFFSCVEEGLATMKERSGLPLIP